MRVEVHPELFTWARERARIQPADLAHRFPKLDAWEAGDVSPTLRQLEDYAAATHAPVGFFFLPRPPHEEVPLPDFRTIRDEPEDLVGAKAAVARFGVSYPADRLARCARACTSTA